MKTLVTAAALMLASTVAFAASYEDWQQHPQYPQGLQRAVISNCSRRSSKIIRCKTSMVSQGKSPRRTRSMAG